MSRYLCTCGKKFKNKRTADIHENSMNYSGVNFAHNILKRDFKIWLLDYLSENYRKILKYSGFIILLAVLENHFKFSTNEAMLLGLAFGLILD